MLWIHPILQTLCLVLATYALSMGINRFRFQHLKQKCPFNWKRHVKVGKVVVWLWLVGLVIGVYAAHRGWGSGLTGGHYWVGLWMIPLILVSMLTGFALQKPCGKRPRLALLHGVSNIVLYLLALYQTWTGLEVIGLFMAG